MLAGLRPTFVAPEVDVELGLAHCVLPSALDAALAAHARRGGGDRRLADLLRCCGRRRRPRPRCARPRRAARCRRGVGRAPGLLRRASAARAGRRRGPRHLEHAQARRQPDPVGDAAPRCRRAPSTRPPSTARCGSSPRRARAACCSPRWTRRDATRRSTAATCCARRSPSSPCCASEIRHVSGLDVLDERVVGAFGVAAIDPLRVCIDVRATGLSGYEVARRMRSDGDVHVELCGEHIVVAVFGLGERVAEQGARPGRGARARVRGRDSGGPGADAGARAGAPRAAVGRGRAVAAGGVPGGAPAGADRARRRAGSRRSAWPPTRPGSPTCYRASA